jgi:hypothetical protein
MCTSISKKCQKHSHCGCVVGVQRRFWTNVALAVARHACNAVFPPCHDSTESGQHTLASAERKRLLSSKYDVCNSNTHTAACCGCGACHLTIAHTSPAAPAGQPAAFVLLRCPDLYEQWPTHSHRGTCGDCSRSLRELFPGSWPLLHHRYLSGCSFKVSLVVCIAGRPCSSSAPVSCASCSSCPPGTRPSAMGRRCAQRCGRVSQR